MGMDGLIYSLYRPPQLNTNLLTYCKIFGHICGICLLELPLDSILGTQGNSVAAD